MKSLKRFRNPGEAFEALDASEVREAPVGEGFGVVVPGTALVDPTGETISVYGEGDPTVAAIGVRVGVVSSAVGVTVGLEDGE